MSFKQEMGGLIKNLMEGLNPDIHRMFKEYEFKVKVVQKRISRVCHTKAHKAKIFGFY